MKVLVVDDDVVSRMVLMHLIGSCGDFEIHEAEDGEEAWHQLEQGLRPAITFCDLRMPRLSGMDLLQRVKGQAELRAMPFVLVSSANDSDTVHAASGQGASGYIVKPFEADQVREHLDSLTRAPAADDGSDAEAPAATLVRLGVNADRLLAYLGGFQAQLSTAGGDIEALVAREQLDDAAVRIERLRAGCATLGLTAMEQAFAALCATPDRIDAIHSLLADAIRASMRQAERVKRLRSAT